MSEGAIERFYRRFASVYDLVFDRVMHPGRVAAIQAMQLASGCRVLEVGVGTGLNLPLYPKGVHVTGVDVSGPMLAKARRRANALPGLHVELHEMDAEHLSLPDDAFDCVYAPYVVSVVARPDIALREMKRVCRPGGALVIVNHFHSRNPLGAWFESTLSPLAHHVGFRLDLPASHVLAHPGLQVERDRRVNLLGMWRLIVLRKPGGARRTGASEPVEATIDLARPEPTAGL